MWLARDVKTPVGVIFFLTLRGGGSRQHNPSSVTYLLPLLTKSTPFTLKESEGDKLLQGNQQRILFVYRL